MENKNLKNTNTFVNCYKHQILQLAAKELKVDLTKHYINMFKMTGANLSNISLVRNSDNYKAHLYVTAYGKDLHLRISKLSDKFKWNISVEQFEELTPKNNDKTTWIFHDNTFIYLRTFTSKEWKDLKKSQEEDYYIIDNVVSDSNSYVSKTSSIPTNWNIKNYQNLNKLKDSSKITYRVATNNNNFHGKETKVFGFDLDNNKQVEPFTAKNKKEAFDYLRKFDFTTVAYSTFRKNKSTNEEYVLKTNGDFVTVYYNCNFYVVKTTESLTIQQVVDLFEKEEEVVVLKEEKETIDLELSFEDVDSYIHFCLDNNISWEDCSRLSPRFGIELELAFSYADLFLQMERADLLDKMCA